MSGNAIETGRSVTSKVVAILMTFADGEAHTLTEVARLAGMPTSTVHRLMGELAESGALERIDGSHYRVGLPLKAICTLPARPPHVHERAQRVMQDLSTAALAPVRLGVLAEGRVAYIEKASVQSPVSSYADGSTVPVHASSMGKALLAFSPPGTLDMIVARGLKAYTRHTLTSAEALRKSLARTRASRVAISRWELVMGVSTVAVPVFGEGGTVTAALELTVRDLRSDMRLVHPLLVVAARSMSHDLATSPG